MSKHSHWAHIPLPKLKLLCTLNFFYPSPNSGWTLHPPHDKVHTNSPPWIQFHTIETNALSWPACWGRNGGLLSAHKLWLLAFSRPDRIVVANLTRFFPKHNMLPSFCSDFRELAKFQKWATVPPLPSPPRVKILSLTLGLLNNFFFGDNSWRTLFVNRWQAPFSVGVAPCAQIFDTSPRADGERLVQYIDSMFGKGCAKIHLFAVSNSMSLDFTSSPTRLLSRHKPVRTNFPTSPYLHQEVPSLSQSDDHCTAQVQEAHSVTLPVCVTYGGHRTQHLKYSSAITREKILWRAKIKRLLHSWFLFIFISIIYSVTPWFEKLQYCHRWGLLMAHRRQGRCPRVCRSCSAVKRTTRPARWLSPQEFFRW